jgi:hypothetical protein
MDSATPCKSRDRVTLKWRRERSWRSGKKVALQDVQNSCLRLILIDQLLDLQSHLVELLKVLAARCHALQNPVEGSAIGIGQGAVNGAFQF